MRVGTIIAAVLACGLAAGEAEAVTEDAAGGVALGPAANPAIADTLHGRQGIELGKRAGDADRVHVPDHVAIQRDRA